MPISVNPTLPVIAAQAVAPDLVLQPGTVVDALVLKVLSENLVRIAIAGLSLDVLSEVPLAAGQSLQLAVSQTDAGIRLAVVGQGRAVAAPADAAPLASAPLQPASPDVPIDAVANPAAVTVTPPKTTLTPLQQVAVSVAARSAATQQASLAPLFANLGVVAVLDGLPPKLQQAVIEVLAQQTSLDGNLTGSDVKNAVQKSGIFLEASLASGSVSSAAGIPDLKAALLVLRQTLVSLGAVLPGTPVTAATEVATAPHIAATPMLAPSLSPDVQEILLPVPEIRLPVAGDSLELGNGVRIVLPETLVSAGPHAMTAGAALNLLQAALRESPDVVAKVANTSLPTVTVRDIRNDDVTFRTNTPPPPFRGALPTAQPVAAPSIALNAPFATTAHHLLADTEAAIARQTLLQVASLPDRVDAAGARPDQAAPRWNFEIPFAAPQGTAMAQFEISRDGGGSEVDGAKRVWRARFSLDIEPAGPVHALVSLSGERTSVRMWAERPATAAQLRAGAAQLSQALSKADLHPGDIVIQLGAPLQTASAPAGHFLDRAL
jgi:hypothetical protein